MAYPLLTSLRSGLIQCGFANSDVNRVVDIIYGAFGREWIEARDLERKGKNPFIQHPISVALASGSMLHFMELVELCVYLLRFKNDPALSGIISAMKGRDQYEDNLFQLAMAYRFSEMAMDVTLEPDINYGHRADFYACDSELAVTAECTVTGEWLLSRETRNVFWECSRKLEKIQLASRRPNQIVIDIVSNTEIRFNGLPQLQRDIMETGRNFISSNEVNIVIPKEEWTISVSILTPELEKEMPLHGSPLSDLNEWQQIIGFSLVGSDVAQRMMNGGLPPDKSTSYMRYKTLNKATSSIEDRLDSRAQDKLGQLRAHPQDRLSILFIQAMDRMDSFDKNRFGHRLQKNMFEHVPSLSAVFVVTRESISHLKHYYGGCCFGGDEAGAVRGLFNRFQEIEKKLDFIQKWRQCFPE